MRYRVEAVGINGATFRQFAPTAQIFAPSDPFRGVRFSLACGATSLYPGEEVRFTLFCQRDGDTMESGEPFLDSLELYCEEVPLQQAGRNPVEPAQEKQEAATSLQSMSARRPLHLVANKRRVEFLSRGEGRFTVPQSQFGLGSGYRFFIRPKGLESPMAPGVDLPLALAREIWASPHSHLNPISSLELVPDVAIAALLYQRLSFQPANLAYFPLSGQNLTRFELEWGPAADEPALDGGVEIELRDFDDPSVVHIRRLETFEMAAWHQIFRDFSALNDWSRTEGRINQVAPMVCLPEAPARYYLPSKMRDYERFFGASTDLVQAIELGSWTETLRKFYSWDQAASAVSLFLERCPAVSVWLTSMRQAVAVGIRLLVLGAHMEAGALSDAVKAGDLALLALLSKREEIILEILRSVESARVQPGDGPTGVLDLNVLAKPAARILRRRSNLTFHALDPEVVSRLPASDGHYPAASRLTALRNRSQRNLPRAEAVFNSCRDNTQRLATELGSLIARIGKGLPARQPASEPGAPDFAPDLQRGLVWAPSLELAIELLESSLGPIQRRPHHPLGSEPIELEEFLPRWLRVHSGPLQSAQPTEEDRRDCYLSLHLLWERLGLAVDLGTTDPAAMEQELSKLDGALREVDPRLYLNVSWLQPVEGSLVAGRDDYVGYGFVRLAVVPMQFYQDLASPDFFRLWVEPRGVFRGELTRDDEALAAVQELWRASVLTQNVWIPQGRERIQPHTREWTAAPTQGGNCRASFYLPDVEGHRFRMRIRRVFRHESLISWLEDRYPRLEADEQGFGPVFYIPGRQLESQAEDRLCVAASLPHPDFLCYIYRLPSAGIRALLSQIGQVRTGFEGVDLQFSFALPEPDEMKPPLVEVLARLELSSSSLETDDAVTVERDATEFLEPFLFRHERMLRLPHHRYYLNYQLEARGQFGGLLSAPARAEASVKPRQLALYPSKLVEVSSLRFKWTLALTRYTDNLVEKEKMNGLPVLKEQSFQVDLLPDQEMQYALYVPTVASPTLLRALVDIRMPWNPEYPSNAAHRGQPYVRSADADVSLVVDSQRGTPAIHDSKRERFWLEVTFDVSSGLRNAVNWSLPVVVAIRPEFAEKVLWKESL